MGRAKKKLDEALKKTDALPDSMFGKEKLPLSKKDLQTSIARLEKDIKILSEFKSGQEEWSLDSLQKTVEFLKETLTKLK